MIMNRVRLVALVVLALSIFPACTDAKKGSASAPNQPTVAQASAALAEVPFLKSLGLDVSRVAIANTFDTKVYQTPEGDKKRVALSEKQADALLDDAPFDYEDDFGTPFIVGAKAFGKQVMLVFRLETGDGSQLMFVTYTQAGKPIDALCTTGWEYTMQWDGESPEGQSVSFDSCYADFSENQFVFHRKVGRNVNGKPAWQQSRHYHYKVNPNGTIMLAKVDLNPVKGTPSAQYHDPTQERLQFQDIFYYPFTDAKALDQLQKLAQSYSSYPDLSDSAMGAMCSLYHLREHQVLTFVANHPNGAFTQLLHQCVKQSWIPKEDLYDDIEDYPNIELRNRLHQLTAQWGPEGAVG